MKLRNLIIALILFAFSPVFPALGQDLGATRGWGDSPLRLLALPNTWTAIQTFTVPILQANGTAAAPSYSFTSNNGSGMYSGGSGIVGITGLNAGNTAITLGANNSDIWYIGRSGTLGSGLFAALDGNQITFGAAADVLFGRAAAANFRHGAADAAVAIGQTISVQNVVAGTSNTAGGNFTITGSQGTGTGVGGNIIFRTAPAGGSGSTQNALVTALTIDQALHLISAGAAPALSACGTTPSIVGNDTSGQITIGGGVVTSCTATFSKAFTNAPACVISDNITAATSDVTTTTTTMVVASSATINGAIVNYICIGR